MQPISNLPSLVQTAVGQVKAHTKGEHAELTGPIIPRWLPAAMPPYGTRSSKMDKIALLLMAEIISAYLPKCDQVFFRGFAYQINRSELASRWGCNAADITRALTFLEREGMVQRTHRPHLGPDGEYAGKAAFVIPVVGKIVDRINEAKCRSKASDPIFSGTLPHPSSAPISKVSGTAVVVEAHLSPNSAEEAVKADESNGGAARRATHGRATASAASGGCQPNSIPDDPTLLSSALAAPEARPCKSKSSPAFSAGVGGNPTSTAPAATDQQPSAPVNGPQESADRFITIWIEAIQRYGVLSPYQPSKSDRRAALKFFSENPKYAVLYLIFLALQAWALPRFNSKHARSDRFYHCRRALGIGDFFHNITQIQCELLQDGLDSSASAIYRTLRQWFLDAELTAMGFTRFVLRNLSTHVPTEWRWENADPEAFRNYYIGLNRPVPVVTPAAQTSPASAASPALDFHDRPATSTTTREPVSPSSCNPPTTTAPPLPSKAEAGTMSGSSAAVSTATSKITVVGSQAICPGSGSNTKAAPPPPEQCDEARPCFPLGSAIQRQIAARSRAVLAKGTDLDPTVTGSGQTGNQGVFKESSGPEPVASSAKDSGEPVGNHPCAPAAPPNPPAINPSPGSASTFPVAEKPDELWTTIVQQGQRLRSLGLLTNQSNRPVGA